LSRASGAIVVRSAKVGKGNPGFGGFPIQPGPEASERAQPEAQPGLPFS
jgi:hypothetical protein